MRISDWSSDVCSSDLTLGIAKLAIDKNLPIVPVHLERLGGARFRITLEEPVSHPSLGDRQAEAKAMMTEVNQILERWIRQRPEDWLWLHRQSRSEEHTSELQSLMRISYAVFCLKTKTIRTINSKHYMKQNNKIEYSHRL